MRVDLRMLRDWWFEDVDYRWVVGAIAARSALGVVKNAIGLCGLVAPVIAVLTVFSPELPHGVGGRIALWGLVVVGVIWAVRWWVLPWPGERESLVLAGVADVCITAVCVLSPGYAVRSVGMMLLLVVGVYVSAFHTPKVLAVHTLWALGSAVVLAVPLFGGGDVRSAVIMILGMGAAVVVPPGLHFGYGALRGAMLSDPLTNLLSRRGLDYYAADVFARATPVPVCALMVDLDRFKAVNDTYGHSFGDEVLMRTADRLRAGAPAGSVVSRFGGEEFAMVVRMPVEAAFDTAQRLRRAIAEPIGAVTVTASIGLAVAEGLTAAETGGERCPLRDIICVADDAMYRAKQRGGDAVVVARSPGPVMTHHSTGG